MGSRLGFVSARIGNVVIESPEPEALAGFYAELLGMRPQRRPPDWMVIGRDDEYLHLAFDPVGEDWQPPRWPDPQYPQQVHLEITVPDQVAVESWLPARGATRLPNPKHHVWADPVGHPFCLFEVPGPARVGTIVLDAEDHAALAAFYGELLGADVGNSWSDWIDLEDGSRPRLAFARVGQHKRPQWPNSAFPQQMHIDFSVDDRTTAQTAERLGAIRLPAMGGSCPVYADPAGHPFCLCSPGQ